MKVGMHTLDAIKARLLITDTCWLWLGPITPSGYGRTSFEGRIEYVHRVMYEAAYGSILNGRELDHLCHVPRCANPDHLEAVTHRENMRRGWNANTRKIECARGHAFTEANTYIRKNGSRQCRACKKNDAYLYR